MDEVERNAPLAERLTWLSRTAADTDMGSLLRSFWQPVAVSAKVKPGASIPIRVMSENLTLYRGESGRPYLVGGLCAHRLTQLHTGWVQGEDIRCVYHGWKYDGTGQCTQRPAEDDRQLPNVKIAGYPLHEYCGLVFAYMGKSPAPPFDLPRKEAFEQTDIVLNAGAQTWPCNWLQQVENSLDAVHVSFAHHAGKVGPFGEAITAAIPKLEYSENESGIRQIATRAKGNVRISDWTFPNNNHIVIPGMKGGPWTHTGVWVVPVDDTHATRFAIRAMPAPDAESRQYWNDYFQRFADYNPANAHDELFVERKFPEDDLVQLTNAQDYIAQVGQGPLVDRSQERLGKSDMGIALLRRILWRELEAIRSGRPTKQWRRLAESVDLPIPDHVKATA